MASSPHPPANPSSPAAATAATAAARASTVAASLALPSSHDPVVRIPVWAGVVVRVLLFTYTDAAPYFRNRVEVVTPITSWKRLQEGLFMYRHGIPPYEGGVFHQAPLLLIVFNFLPPILIPLLFILLDYWIARALVAVATHKRALQIAEVWPPARAAAALDAAEAKAQEEDDKAQALTMLDGTRGGDTVGKSLLTEGGAWFAKHAGGAEPPVASDEEREIDHDDTVLASMPTTDVPPWLADDTDAVVQGKPAYERAGAPPIVKPADPTQPVDNVLHPEDVGSLYLLNPYSIMTCLAQSTLLFTLLAMVAGLQYAIAGKRAVSMMCLAIAAYLSLYPVMMVAPAVLLLAQRRAISPIQELKTAAPLFLGSLATIFGLSYLLIGSWEFLPSTYGVILSVSDLTPNIGLFWYFFIEMFDQFRPFFLCVFQIMVFVFVMPISLVFRDHPLFVAFAMSAIMAIFKPYPSVGDTALYLAFFAMHQELFKYMRNNYLVFAAMLFATVLGPLFHYLWVYAGSGNANFYFAITLVFGLARIILLTDTGHALVLREWERLHPDLRRRRVEIVHK
ncbi:hypothetical protein HDU87_004391 [Geranomyces variabilis]|uniref:Uncharacterized protein n=1 Tax=Geranomyces variabilis TaxID=109894 RepID=A0AAD5TKW9_9FUNG|nr:hypothetical protein HDU87_004391 [Geranomyces variabilis]